MFERFLICRHYGYCLVGLVKRYQRWHVVRRWDVDLICTAIHLHQPPLWGVRWHQNDTQPPPSSTPGRQKSHSHKMSASGGLKHTVGGFRKVKKTNTVIDICPFPRKTEHFWPPSWPSDPGGVSPPLQMIVLVTNVCPCSLCKKRKKHFWSQLHASEMWAITWLM